ncbi:MAG: Hsp20/alpha crystallin family protein [Planctomycetota bacterium]
MVRVSSPFFPFSTLSPFSLLESLGRQGSFRGPLGPRMGLQAWTGDSGLFLRLAVPGLDPASLEVAVEEDRLHVQGKRLDGAPEGARELQGELSGEPLNFQLRLPFRPSSEGMEARYERGVLALTLPRPAEERPRRIDIQTR